MDEIDLRDDPTDRDPSASKQQEEWAQQPTTTRDWDAYERLYISHIDKLRPLALLLCHGDRGRAEDIVSDVFIDAWPAWRQGRVSDFAAYARRAVVNRFNGQGRHGAVVDRFLQRRKGDDRGDRLVADDVAERQTLWDALRRLPTGQRTAVVLRYYEDLSVEETASIMGIAIGTVKSQVSDAMRALRRDLDHAEASR